MAVAELFLAAVVLVGMTSCHPFSSIQDREEQIPKSDKAFGASLCSFSVDLYKQVVGHGNATTKNTFFSPLSIASVLGMLLGGSGGATARQIESALHVDGASVHRQFHEYGSRLRSRQSKVTLRCANRLYSDVQYAIHEKYRNLLRDFYNSSVESVELRNAPDVVRNKINKWVEKQTASKIKNLIKPGSIRKSSTLLLVNAIYFKAQWKTEFNPQETLTGLFFGESKETSIQMMSGLEESFNRHLDEDLDVDAIDVPYVGEDLSMLILLPERNDGLADLERKLTGPKLKRLIHQMAPMRTVLSMPKFRLEWEAKLVDALKAIGIRDLFTGSADLSGISGQKGLKVSQFFHKAFIEVNEKGTEAAAASTAVLRVSAEKDRLFYSVDHPFLFVIRCRNGEVPLFIGSVRDL